MAVSGGLFPATAAGTAKFTSRIDDIFDCLNSSTFKNTKELNRPVTAESNHCEFIKNACLFGKQITVKDRETEKDVTLNCLRALEITLYGTVLIWNTIQPVAKFLCTRRLNQDPLENFFG